MYKLWTTELHITYHKKRNILTGFKNNRAIPHFSTTHKLFITDEHPINYFVGKINTTLAITDHPDYTLSMSVTYQPKKRKRAKTHGFMARKKTAAGKSVLKRRMQKGRARLAV